MGGGADLTHRRQSYFSGCMSPSCVPVHEEYSRVDIHRAGSGRRKWRKMIKRLVREGKSIYVSKPSTFQYDAVSYSQNFDEGGHHNEDYGRCTQVIRDYRLNVYK